MSIKMKDMLHVIQVEEFQTMDGQTHNMHEIPITQRELELIERFATVEILPDMNREYTLNKVKFKIGLYFPKENNI